MSCTTVSIPHDTRKPIAKSKKCFGSTGKKSDGNDHAFKDRVDYFRRRTFCFGWHTNIYYVNTHTCTRWNIHKHPHTVTFFKAFIKCRVHVIMISKISCRIPARSRIAFLWCSPDVKRRILQRATQSGFSMMVIKYALLCSTCQMSAGSLENRDSCQLQQLGFTSSNTISKCRGIC